MTPHGNPFPGRVEIGLRRNRVLEVTQVVSGIGEQFDEGDTEIRNVAFPPIGNQQWETIENQLAKTRVILGEIMDLRLGQRFRLALTNGCAIKIRRAINFEIEVD